MSYDQSPKNTFFRFHLRDKGWSVSFDPPPPPFEDFDKNFFPKFQNFHFKNGSAVNRSKKTLYAQKKTLPLIVEIFLARERRPTQRLQHIKFAG